MKNLILLFISAWALCLLGTGCASSNDRSPQSRSGRPYQEPRAMNHRQLDSNTLYEACLRERPEVSCRNRMGR